MSGLNGRVRKLEDEFTRETDDGGRDLAERLADAIEEARERRRLGLPRPTLMASDDDPPLVRRLAQAHAHAEALRQQLAGE